MSSKHWPNLPSVFYMLMSQFPPRSHHSAVYHRGLVYVVGGITTSHMSPAVGQVDAYDPFLDQWTSYLPPLPFPVLDAQVSGDWDANVRTERRSYGPFLYRPTSAAITLPIFTFLGISASWENSRSGRLGRP